VMARFGLVRVPWAPAWPKMLPGSEHLTPETRTVGAGMAEDVPGSEHLTPETRTAKSAPIWRRVEPWTCKSAARSMSAAPR
jgi:hypothetical protein